MNPFLTCSSLPHPLHRSPIRSPHRQSHCRPIWAIYAIVKPSYNTLRIISGRLHDGNYSPDYILLVLWQALVHSFNQMAISGWYREWATAPSRTKFNYSPETRQRLEGFT